MDQRPLLCLQFPPFSKVSVPCPSYRCLLAMGGRRQIACCWAFRSWSKCFQRAVLKGIHLWGYISTGLDLQGDILDFELLLGWEFWRPWKKVNVFCLFEGYESLGARENCGSQSPCWFCEWFSLLLFMTFCILLLQWITLSSKLKTLLCKS